MDLGLLRKLFGNEQQWHGPCMVIMDADVSVTALGGDTILGGGAKQFAPRMVSGRFAADAVSLLQDGTALLIVQQLKTRHQTGEETIRQMLTIADRNQVVAIEFPDIANLTALGVGSPPVRNSTSLSGIFPRAI